MTIVNRFGVRLIYGIMASSGPLQASGTIPDKSSVSHDLPEGRYYVVIATNGNVPPESGIWTGDDLNADAVIELTLKNK